MSSLDSFITFVRDDSWRSALRRCRQRIVRRKDARSRIVIGSKIPHERTDSGVVLDHTLRIKEAAASITTVSLTPTLNEPSTHRALHVISGKKYKLEEECLVPEFLNDEEVMIRSCAVGLNNIDWKSVDYNFCLPEFPWVTGREMAGVVERVAPGVTNFKVGDRVWTSTYYRDRRAGCFQDLVTVPQHTVLPLPSNTTFESAACLGVAGLTAGMTLWRWLDIPLRPTSTQTETQSQKDCILIWGGSTVTGQFAVQIAAQAGLEVIAVTSSKTAALVSRLGAHHVVQRDGKTNEQITEEIRATYGDRITRGIDLVGQKTAPFCIEAMSRTERCLFAPLAMMKAQETAANMEVVNVEMKQFVLDKQCAVYAERLNELIGLGEMKLPELDVIPGGLDVIEEGLERMKKGDLGGKKLIVSWTK